MIYFRSHYGNTILYLYITSLIGLWHPQIEQSCIFVHFYLYIMPVYFH